MQLLKQSTAVDVLIGPFLDKTDALTAETGESPSVKLSKNGQALAAKNDVTTPVHDADGYHNCELDATDTNTVGTLVLTVVGSANALPVRHEYQVVEEAVYDAMYAASAAGPLQSTVAARTLDVSAGGEAGLDWANIGSPTTAQNLSGTNIDTDQVVASVSGAVGSVTGAVGSVTGAVGSVTGAVGSVTGSVGSVAGNVDGSVASVVGHTAQTGDTFVLANGATGFAAIDTVVDAIKVKTDFLPSVVAGGAGGVFIAGTNAATTITTGLTTTFTGNLTGSVASVTGAVGSVTGNVGGSVASVTGAVGSVTGAVGSVTGHTNQTGDSFGIVNGAAGLVAIDTVVDAIKVVTDKMVFTKVNQLDVNTLSINGAAVVGDGNATPWDGA